MDVTAMPARAGNVYFLPVVARAVNAQKVEAALKALFPEAKVEKTDHPRGQDFLFRVYNVDDEEIACCSSIVDGMAEVKVFDGLILVGLA